MYVFTEFYLGDTELETHFYYYQQYKHARVYRILYGKYNMAGRKNIHNVVMEKIN